MGKQDPPEPPDLQPISDAQLEMAQMADELAREYLGLSREQFAYFQEQGQAELAYAREQAERLFGLQQDALDSQNELNDITGQVGQAQLEALNDNLTNARFDRERYESIFLPMQDRMIEEANAYDTPERREAEAARHMVDVQRQADAQRSNVEQRMRGMGLDPSQFRSGALANQMATGTAAAQAQAGNQARTNIEDRGRAMRADAVNMGMGLPSQVASSYNGLTGAGQGAVQAGSAGQGATLGAIGAYGQLAGQGLGMRSGALSNLAGLTGTGLQWSGAGTGAMGMSGNFLNNAAGTMNMGYQNQMSQWNAQQQQQQAMISNVMGMAGAVAAFSEGGAVGMARRRPAARYATEGAAVGLDPEKFSNDATVKPREKGEGKSKVTKAAKVAKADRASSFSGALGAAASNASDNAARFDTSPRDFDPGYIYMAGGGALPVRQSRDKIPAVLAEGEFVVPADVVRSKGIEFFDKLVQKHHRAGA
jgi:hypothetical protein